MKVIKFNLDLLRSVEPREEEFKKKLSSSSELMKIFAYFYEMSINQGVKNITVRDVAKWIRKSEPQVRQWFYILKDYGIINESMSRVKGKTIGYFLNRNDGEYEKYLEYVEEKLK